MRLANRSLVKVFKALILLSALAVMDSGSALQSRVPQLVNLSTPPMVTRDGPAPVKPESAVRDPRCAVWASCNGQRQAYRLAPRKAVLLAMAASMNGS